MPPGTDRESDTCKRRAYLIVQGDTTAEMIDAIQRLADSMRSLELLNASSGTGAVLIVKGPHNRLDSVGMYHEAKRMARPSENPPAQSKHGPKPTPAPPPKQCSCQCEKQAR